MKKLVLFATVLLCVTLLPILSMAAEVIDTGHKHPEDHVFATGTRIDNLQHEATCACGETIVEDHNMGAWEQYTDRFHRRTCSVCGWSERETHTMDGGVVTRESTCTTYGETTFSCTKCDRSYKEPMEDLNPDAHGSYYGFKQIDHETHLAYCGACHKEMTLGHHMEIVSEIKATHAAAGRKTSQCLDCGFEHIEWIPKIEHKWDEGVETVPATHTASGKKTYTCECGETKTEQIEKTAEHEWDGGEITTPATHVTFGTKTYTCTCGATQTEQVDKTAAHEWNGGEITTPATHIAFGTKTYTCICGAIQTEQVDKTAAHEWDNGTIVIPPTHTAEGLKIFICTCGETRNEPLDKLVEHAYTLYEKVDAHQHKTACVCGAFQTEEHIWNDGEITAPATHLTAGVKTFTCICGEVRTEAIDRLPSHTYTLYEKLDVNQHKVICSCGDFLTAAHAWNEGEITAPATHAAFGEKTYACICGEAYTEALEKIPHVWDSGVVTTPATHVTEGEATYTCECGETQTRVIERLPAHTYDSYESTDTAQHRVICACGDFITEHHAWDHGEVTTPATHTAFGEKTYTCRCGKTRVEPVDKTTAHEWDYGKITTPPTHIAFGEKNYTCICGEIKVEPVDKTTAHEWDNGVITTPATHTTFGVKTYACICGTTKAEAVDKLPNHVYDLYESLDANQHRWICACGEAITEDHSIGEWEYYTDRYHRRTCSFCNWEQEKATHSMDGGVITVVPTCTVYGVTTYTCTGCGFYYEEAFDKNQSAHTYAEFEPTTVTHHWASCDCGHRVELEHNFESTIINEPSHTECGLELLTCRDCGFASTVVLPPSEHEWDNGVISTPATHTTAGVKTITCSCGETKTEGIARLPDHTYDLYATTDESQHKILCACGDFITENHTWDDGEITTQATHTATGVKSFTCICGERKAEVIDTLTDHAYTNYEPFDAEQHKITCVCNAFITEHHIWDNGEITAHATHTAEGVKTFTCTCGETYTEAIAKTTAHEWDDGSITTPATHTAFGIKTYACLCGEAKLEQVDKTPDHEWDSGVETTPATHIAEGIKTFTCACGETYTKAIAKTTEHEWNDGEVTTPATHITEGVKTFTCTCGETETEAIAKTIEHEWSEGVVTTPATQATVGVKTYTCTCGETKTESIPKLVTNIESVDSNVTLEVPANSQVALPAGTVLNVVDQSNEELSEEILDDIAEAVKTAETAKTVVETLAVYDLSLVLDGTKIQPNGAVVVTLPAPQITTTYDRILVVYIASDGSYEECKTTVNEDGTISFETDHFSKYAIIGINEAEEGTADSANDANNANDADSANNADNANGADNVNNAEDVSNGLGTGAIVAIVIGAVAVLGAGGFAIYWFAIRKKTVAKQAAEQSAEEKEEQNAPAATDSDAD